MLTDTTVSNFCIPQLHFRNKSKCLNGLVNIIKLYKHHQVDANLAFPFSIFSCDRGGVGA